MDKVKNRKSKRNERGSILVEYMILAVGTATAATMAVQTLGNEMNGMLTDTAGAFHTSVNTGQAPAWTQPTNVLDMTTVLAQESEAAVYETVASFENN